MMKQLLLLLILQIVLLPSLHLSQHVLVNANIPIGINLSPLGGGLLGGLEYADVDWDPVSTFVFINLYKHCTELYIRTVSNCNFFKIL
jgi:hypothetical protein